MPMQAVNYKQCHFELLWLSVECINVQLNVLSYMITEGGRGETSGKLERVPQRLTTSENFKAITHPIQAIQHENSRCECRIAITVFATLLIIYCLTVFVCLVAPRAMTLG